MKKTSRTRPLKWAFIMFILMSVTKLTSYAQEKKPNIIYILSDDQAWNDYGFTGHPHIETPNIDKLAEEGHTFTRGYVTAPLCSPSLASIITGLYPYQHGITGNDPEFNFEGKRYSNDWQIARSRLYKDYLDEFQKHPTIPMILKKLGYLSFQAGKWWGGNYKEGGFTHGMTHGDPSRGGRHGDVGLKIGREGMDPIFDFMDQAIDEDKPFFVWYAPFLPHSPHNPPDSLLQKYLPLAPSKSVASYWAMCEWFDITIGQLLDRVEEKGLSENTLVVFVTDNGWIQDPDTPNKFVKGSKQAPQDMGIRTPIIYKWPKKIKPKMDHSNLASSIDMAVTTMAAVGLDPLPNMQGINIMDKKALKNRKEIYSMDFAHDMKGVEVPEKTLESRILITSPWKIIVPGVANEDTQEVMLYNILKDPLEENNLAEKHPEVVAKLTASLNKWWNN
ncbi:sulfatase family protein [Cyclobacterium marinum]|uniref:Sulfatase n=1 Tax=Cyclobacterium marinum (strain ATCC 25205 / DSM 745 / LMG 13164 / NCIMB 1802) TaxID=880070 RepID=G0J6K9_CYCMS|nr:sulfatase [Cyclobacterium marinum]AEL28524.1 sulfatase [Cyclobacterium marinum DSM 745]